MEVMLLLIAHLLGDFFFQSSDMALKKITSKRYFIMHCLIYSLCIVLALIWFGPLNSIIIAGAIIITSHALIDFLRNVILRRIVKKDTEKKGLNFAIFIIDQILHIAVIIYSVQLIKSTSILGVAVNNYLSNYFTYQEMHNIIVVVLMFAICMTPAAVLIKKVFILFSLQEENKDGGDSDIIKNGYLIGVLERGIILFLWIVGQLSAIGFILAAKSLARFKQLNDKNFSEKYLIGTLLSTLIALACIAGGDLLILQ